MSRKHNWRNRNGASQLVFRGHKTESDALTVAQSEYLIAALRAQRDIYKGRSFRISREPLHANGSMDALRRRQQTLNALVNGLALILGRGYFSEYSRSLSPDGEICVPLEFAFAQIEQDVLNVGAVVRVVEAAALDWSRTQPYGSSRLGRIHAAVKKIRGYYDYMCVSTSSDSLSLEKRLAASKATD